MLTPPVLIVDDDASDVRLISRMLRQGGHRVVAALNGRDGLKRALEHQPGAVLMDLRMPGQSGLDVARLMSADPRLCEIPILFLSAADDLKSKLGAFSSGAVDYITKPFSIDELTARLHVHMRKRVPLSTPSCQTPPCSESNLEIRRDTFEKRILAKVKNEIDARLAESLTVVDLARSAGVSVRRLNEIFQVSQSMTTFEYVRAERFRRACELLLKSDLSIGLVADQTGFASQAAFTYAFRQRHGITPSEYRLMGGVELGFKNPC